VNIEVQDVHLQTDDDREDNDDRESASPRVR